MYRILIVDDVPEVCGAVEKLLKEEGYETETARQGASALQKIEQWEPHLVILDLILPDMNGFAVLRRFAKRGTLRPCWF